MADLLPNERQNCTCSLPNYIVLTPAFNLALILRLYDPLNRILPNVPYPTVPTNRNAHVLVMMRPVGNIPSVVPGNTNGVAPAGTVEVEAARAVAALV